MNRSYSAIKRHLPTRTSRAGVLWLRARVGLCKHCLKVALRFSKRLQQPHALYHHSNSFRLRLVPLSVKATAPVLHGRSPHAKILWLSPCSSVPLQPRRRANRRQLSYFVMYDVHSFRGWNYDLRDDFIGSKVMLAFAFSLRNDIEPFKRKLALTLWSLKSDFGRIGDQHQSYGGGTHELRGPIMTQNVVKARLDPSLIFGNERLAGLPAFPHGVQWRRRRQRWVKK